ncbi:unnamed protein product [Sphacelaria rigidula]
MLYILIPPKGSTMCFPGAYTPHTWHRGLDQNSRTPSSLVKQQSPVILFFLLASSRFNGGYEILSSKQKPRRIWLEVKPHFPDPFNGFSCTYLILTTATRQHAIPLQLHARHVTPGAFSRSWGH